MTMKDALRSLSLRGAVGDTAWACARSAPTDSRSKAGRQNRFSKRITPASNSHGSINRSYRTYMTYEILTQPNPRWSAITCPHLDRNIAACPLKRPSSPSLVQPHGKSTLGIEVALQLNGEII